MLDTPYITSPALDYVPDPLFHEVEAAAAARLHPGAFKVRLEPAQMDGQCSDYIAVDPIRASPALPAYQVRCDRGRLEVRALIVEREQGTAIASEDDIILANVSTPAAAIEIIGRHIDKELARQDLAFVRRASAAAS